MEENYIDREFAIPAHASMALSGLVSDPKVEMDLCHPIFKTKEYSGRKQILFELEILR